MKKNDSIDKLFKLLAIFGIWSLILYNFGYDSGVKRTQLEYINYCIKTLDQPPE